jgi:hypothetical protein
MQMTNSIALAARNVANAGHTLCEATREALDADQRARWDALELAGAEVALTIKWSRNRCELRLGLIVDDAPPQGVLSLDFPRVAETER